MEEKRQRQLHTIQRTTSSQLVPTHFLREKPWGRGCSADQTYQTDCETLIGSLDFSLCSRLFRRTSQLS